MTTEQTSMLQGDLLAQRRFTLQALVSDAVSTLTGPCTGLWTIDRQTELHALLTLQQAATELRALPSEDDVPF